MDGELFDRIAKNLAGRGPRRDAVKRSPLAGGVNWRQAPHRRCDCQEEKEATLPQVWSDVRWQAEMLQEKRGQRNARSFRPLTALMWPSLEGAAAGWKEPSATRILGHR